MSSQMLNDAREYEAKVGNSVLEEERPRFHLSSRSGWMNDPNGFSYYKGEYHLFYQYFPYDNRWGPMHWAHAKSKDLIHWEYLPAALAPDTTADADGCFSGSAFELNDGRQALMYTGVNVTDEYKKYIQTQCVAVIDDNGEYVKYEGNPVLTSKDLPEGYSRYDFRDPKVFRLDDGTWACVICACKGKTDGRIVYYTSENGIDWTFKSVLAENNGRYGTIWECPDFFELDGKHALICSPMNMTNAV